MTTLMERQRSEEHGARGDVALHPSLTTRYGAAPHPRSAVREPTFVHTFMVATWLGRLIDPADVVHRRPVVSRGNK